MYLWRKLTASSDQSQLACRKQVGQSLFPQGRSFHFAFTDAAGTVLGRQDVTAAFTHGRDTETIQVDRVPAGATSVSRKERLHFLRRRVALAGTDPDFTADFTGPGMLLGGDYNDDNFVEVCDFAQFLRDFSRVDRPESDINGDGTVNILDFNYIASHYFWPGDPE